MYELQEEIHAVLNDYDAIVATGVDNFTYLSGVVLPFAYNYPDRKAVIVKTKNGQDDVIVLDARPWAGTRIGERRSYLHVYYELVRI